MKQILTPRARLSGLLMAAAVVVSAATRHGYRRRPPAWPPRPPMIWTRDMLPERRPPEP
ncbi:hypothetical protein [Dactylosporangium darangshiense]|uniref:hypothetical protein n=1 Tax=Dactylosporangium darangshiense TaxID=579108 RepID=UPI002C8FE5E3|nr:hypothetical protein [Dactylosporangium sp.]